MLRTKKQQCSLDISKLNSSINTTQTTTQTMEKQIDNYTRRLQQDKRKFFRAQQNYSEIKKQLNDKNKQLEKLKSKKYKTQLITLKGKISTLEGTLDQAINSYNQSLANNNQLKLQIDQLRKDKKTQAEKIKHLNNNLHKISEDILQKKSIIELKKANIQKMKEQIIKFRQINENQVKNYENQLNSLQKNFVSNGKQNVRKKKDNGAVTSQNMDTQPIIKLRLRNIILQNKQKIKIIDHYKKSMHLIFENFEEIKEQSGIQSLEQITKMLLKHEQQNGFIYQYINRLNTNIEELKQGNQDIKKKIEQQEKTNKQRRLLLSGTPEEEKRKRDLQAFKESRQIKIQEMNTFFKEIKGKLVQVFRAYKIIGENEDFELTPNNIQSYLSQLESLLNNSESIYSATAYKAEIKEDVTKYTKLPPSVGDEANSNSKTEERLLEREKLKDFASDFWEKKKQNRMVSSKGTQCKNDSNEQ